MSEWRDIESAPRDGAPFLFCIPDGRIGIAYKEPRTYEGHTFSTYMAVLSGPDEYNQGRSHLSMSQKYLDDATHWMPLPPPPQERDK